MSHILNLSVKAILASALFALHLGSAADAGGPKAYIVGLLTVDNKDWIAEYRSKNSELLKKYGGRILVRGKPADVLEGKAPNAHAILVVEFPSMDQAGVWYSDPDYQPLIKLRQTGLKADFLLIEELKQ